MDIIRSNELVVPLITKSLAGGVITSEKEVTPEFLYTQKHIESLPLPGNYNLLATEIMRLKDEALKPRAPLEDKEKADLEALLKENEILDDSAKKNFEENDASDRVQFFMRNFCLWRELVEREDLEYGHETRMRVLEDLEERLLEFKEFGKHLELLSENKDSEFMACLRPLDVDELKGLEKYYRDNLTHKEKN